MRFPRLNAIQKLLALNYGVSLQYRAQSVLWMITGTVPLIMMMIWLQLAEGGSIKGYDAVTFAQYFMFMFLARQMTPTWVIYLMDRGVKHGELSPLLLRPMHPVWQYATEHWGEMSLRVPIIAPLAAIGLWIADAWSTSLLFNLPFFVIGLLLAWVINFIMHMIVGLIAFWSDNALGYDMMLFSLYTMLGGVVVPVELFPDVVQRYLAWTPFPYILDFPVRAAIGRIEGRDLVAGFGMQLLWLGVLFTLFAIGWRLSLKRFSAAGA
jgi:ABC-2 type transport system permease protein